MAPLQGWLRLVEPGCILHQMLDSFGRLGGCFGQPMKDTAKFRTMPSEPIPPGDTEPPAISGRRRVDELGKYTM